jgi:sulfite reductase (NADPH) hemoprotein beta-component
MYAYDAFDQELVDQRVAQFRGQVDRRLGGDLTEEEFRPLRLLNGLYLQLHAYMLRVAIPYGELSSAQLRGLADISRRHDRGIAHFTTRQNVQFNWIKLEDAPDTLAALARIQMHAIQTSGNTIRNTTADQFAGAAADEIEDPRVHAEIIRQWSTLHPEFSFLPRKFKIAVTGATRDRAAVKTHDIGLFMRRDTAGEIGFEVVVGGGQGRSPVIARTIRKFLPKPDLLSYLEAILRVYNRLGRRDNLYKARIKILVNETGIENFTTLVEDEWARIRDGALKLSDREIARIEDHFKPPPFEALDETPDDFASDVARDRDFGQWARANLHPHKMAGYSIVNVSLKPTGGVPGDASAQQMEALADLADLYSFGEIRVAHEQNLVLPHVRQSDLHVLWGELARLGLATPNIGFVGDIIACPGLDYCSLANARSIPVAQAVSERFADIDRQHDIGAITLNISGCINACGHHHVANIGILGVDKRDKEYYQITLGGRADENAAIGRIIGPAFSEDDIVDAVEAVIETYVARRLDGELFIDAFDRLGIEPFKDRLYGAH